MATTMFPKGVCYRGFPCTVIEHLSTAINFSTVDPMSNFLLFSESLERDLSNDVKYFVGALICHFSALDHGLLFMVWPKRQTVL